MHEPIYNSIAICSGKGGTGKTFVATNLAMLYPNSTYIDCDVEEPNGHLFLKPTIKKTLPVTIQVPHIEQDLCIGCHRCLDVCRFNALANPNHHMIVFENLCVSCGACWYYCPTKALTPKDKVIGSISIGQTKSVSVLTGTMATNEKNGMPIIKTLFQSAPRTSEHVIIDCPPGTACAVIESIQHANYCIIVAEPTLYGLHNMQMMISLLDHLKKPYGVVLNKVTQDDNPLTAYCLEHNIDILIQFPYDEDMAKVTSTGSMAIQHSPIFLKLFETLGDLIMKRIPHATNTHS